MLSKFGFASVILVTSFLSLTAKSDPTTLGSPDPWTGYFNCSTSFQAQWSKYRDDVAKAAGPCADLGVHPNQPGGVASELCGETDPKSGVVKPPNSSNFAANECTLKRCEKVANTCDLPYVTSLKDEKIAAQQKECDQDQELQQNDDYTTCMSDLQAMIPKQDEKETCDDYEAAFTTKDSKKGKAPSEGCQGKAAEEQLAELQKAKGKAADDLETANDKLNRLEKEASREGQEENNQILDLTNKQKLMEEQYQAFMAQSQTKIGANIVRENENIADLTKQLNDTMTNNSDQIAVDLKKASDKYNNATRAAFIACQNFLFSKGNAALTNVSSLDQAGQIAAAQTSGGASSTSNGLLNYRCQRNLAFQSSLSQAYQEEQTDIQQAQINYRRATQIAAAIAKKINDTKKDLLVSQQQEANAMADAMAKMKLQLDGIENQLNLLHQSTLGQAATNQAITQATENAMTAKKNLHRQSCWFSVIGKETGESPRADDKSTPRGDAMSAAASALASNPCASGDYDACLAVQCNSQKPQGAQGSKPPARAQ